MDHLLVKICGVTTAADAMLAADAGADAVGVNFWSGSKRYVAPAAAREVVAAIPSGVLRVGVFVNALAADVARAVGELGLDRVQLHGDETLASYAGFDPELLIRAVRVQDAASFAAAERWQAGLWLYDGFVEGYGGAGTPAPWPLIAAHARRPFLLAGGLTPDNVADAIRATRPNGVDVASGVESHVGVKDARKLAAFIAAARAAI